MTEFNNYAVGRVVRRIRKSKSSLRRSSAVLRSLREAILQ